MMPPEHGHRLQGGADLALIGSQGPLTLLESFEGRRQLIAYYFMWHPGNPAAELCGGCTGLYHQRGAVLPSFSRHHLRGLLSGSLRRKHPLPRLHGLGRAVVLSRGLSRRAPRRAPHRHDAPRVLPTGRRPRLRNLLDDPPRR